ncbi:MAG: hypothetical protein JWR71_3195, partial [Pseudarthrobacter sp.]|nr:hypothetical protein [Pseudarthrobacter sp.]
MWGEALWGPASKASVSSLLAKAQPFP